MDITPYIDSLRRDLLAAADAAGPESREVAERLAYALDPAARLALMEAISQAAAEITAELPAGSVEARLNGRDLDFSVQAPTPLPPTPASDEKDDEPEDGTVLRITLRLPESLKAKAEQAANEAGQSLNTWLVEVIRRATRGGNPDLDLSAIPQMINDAVASFDPWQGHPKAHRRKTGWI